MRVGLVGDSQGVGLRSGLDGALARRGHQLAAAAVQTGATLRVLAGKAAAMPEGLDLLVIVSGGGNDGTSVTSPARWLADVRALAAAAQGRGPRAVVWVGPMPAREGLAAAGYKLAARAGLRAALAGTGVRWLDGFPLAEGVSPRADGLHFDAAGYRTMAERLAPLLLEPPAPSTGVLALAGVSGLVGLGALAWAFTRPRR